MSIKRWDIPPIAYDSGLLEPFDDGDYVLYEDHSEEVARLLHIIAALEGQLKVESEEIKNLRKKLFLCDNIIYELSQE